jgi:general secretion pathway protein K
MVGSVSEPRPWDTLLAEYHAAGLDYGLPGSPLQTVEELSRVLGMTPGVLAAIRPHLTLFGPPPPTASSAVIPCHSARRGCPGPALLPRLNRLRIVLTAWITATAFGPNPRVPRLTGIRIGERVLPLGDQVLARSDARDVCSRASVFGNARRSTAQTECF